MYMQFESMKHRVHADGEEEDLDEYGEPYVDSEKEYAQGAVIQEGTVYDEPAAAKYQYAQNEVEMTPQNEDQEPPSFD